MTEINGYASHLPVLSRLLLATSQSYQVLEYGSGHYSTPLIQSRVHGESIEPGDWYEQLKNYYPNIHQGSPKHSKYGLILVDSAPAETRLEFIEKYWTFSDVWILHDSCHSHLYGYDLIDKFKYSYEYEQLTPHTRILTQQPLLKQIVTELNLTVGE